MDRYDVIVVGAGPAGSTCAKACAEKGLKTLMLDKQRLPRDKVCSGMVMGALAQGLIEQEFGFPPQEVLTHPSQLKGYCFHVPGIGLEKIDNLTWLSWRKELDHWMNQKAGESGVDIRDRAEVVGIAQKAGGLAIMVKREGETRELMSTYAIGADGATSVIRKFLFPNLQVRYGQALQEHFEGEIGLDQDYFHWFYPREINPSFFTVHQKDGTIIMEVAGKPGTTKEIMTWAQTFMAEHHALSKAREPVWRGSCLEPALYRELTSRTFRPARGNVLLVGDAAGFIMPVSGEGIGLAVQSALAAAAAVTRSKGTGDPPDGMYLTGIEPILSCFEKTYPWFKKIMEEAKGEGTSLPGILKQAYEGTLSPIDSTE
ncbi:MAG: FAD-dependent monooxygenase [Deltaproteobacteria bacterium]|nr:FAD-dependent monooxygenase [Deltaproteobacteria bacterium]